ncbi:Potassium channel AKT2/3 [Morella rubra]|uniref:Potassium channel AKT2/3 n=1 Tax=Morella rubra TaxID=262757 RepID=A0A6A1V363_9ROSI|nr:Potassium channel AKT2/3 [Morella rubra]
MTVVTCEAEKEQVVGTMQSGDIFGEVGALCCRPQSFTYRTKTLSQLLRLKTTALIKATQARLKGYEKMLKNFLQVCRYSHVFKSLFFSQMEFLRKRGRKGHPSGSVSDIHGRYRCLAPEFPCQRPWCSGLLGLLESNGWVYSAHCAFRLFLQDNGGNWWICSVTGI